MVCSCLLFTIISFKWFRLWAELYLPAINSTGWLPLLFVLHRGRWTMRQVFIHIESFTFAPNLKYSWCEIGFYTKYVENRLCSPWMWKIDKKSWNYWNSRDRCTFSRNYNENPFLRQNCELVSSSLFWQYISLHSFTQNIFWICFTELLKCYILKSSL